MPRRMVRVIDAIVAMNGTFETVLEAATREALLDRS